ncbi:DoxX family protein [Candidatus Parcubacteria bacterium]|nr:MAG: DoxX family protein [Candidatus Parcubacteria bacterium]
MLNKLKNPNLGILFIRIALAAVFIVHGWQKIQNIEGTVAFFATLGLASFWAYVVTAVEFVGGLAMLLGILTDIAGVLIAIDMFFAIYLVHFKNGFTGIGGYEFALTLLLTALAVALIGPGRYSLSGLVKK